jgi:hypothetical protein
MRPPIEITWCTSGSYTNVTLALTESPPLITLDHAVPFHSVIEM